MSGYLLDTDWCIDLINNQPAAHQAMPAMTRAGVAISLVTYGEL
jgi:predicted nucleic acid-binding protein